MTITVIGHLCLDVIHPSNGGPDTHSYGGIFFSVTTLANLLRETDTVAPVFGVGKNDYDALVARLKQYPNVDTSGIYRFPGPTNQVELTYTSKAERVERSRFIAEPIPWKRIRPSLDEANLVLVNMISGFDITLETLDEIRMEVRDRKVPIYLDVHSLTLGITDEFLRVRRNVDAWRRWIFMLHGVHLNEEEAAHVAPEKPDEPTLAHHALALNTKALHITRGDRGCTVFVDSHKVVQRTDIPAFEPEKAVDPTGCGDVFDSAYCAHYLYSKDVLEATRFANHVAGFKAQTNGSVDIDALSRFRIHQLQATGSLA